MIRICGVISKPGTIFYENKKEKLKDSEKYKLVGADGIIKNTGRDIGAVKNEAKDKAKEILKNKKYRIFREY